jgi:Site-specific recombinases, DNA invertase Pin homologs
MNAVIYARFSCEKQREESIEGQIRICREYAEKNDLTIVGEYIDRAKSARSDKRADFQKMLADSAKRKFSAVLMYKSDRFARNADEAAINRQKLKKNGVQLLYAAEYIPEGPEGIILRAILEGYNEYYSAELALKLGRGMNENALKCKSNGSVTPLGYKVNENGYYEINPETAPAVKKIFEMYAKGETMAEICKTMNGLGIKTNTGGKFGKSTLSRMFEKQIYIGTYQFKDITIENGVPAIIEPEIFERVQERAKMNKNNPNKFKPNREDYILSGKLYCGICEKPMTGKSGVGRHGGKFYYYGCAGKSKKECTKETVRKQWLEDVVIEETRSRILNPDVINQLSESVEEILSKSKEANPKIPMLTAKLAETEKSLEGIIKAIEMGIITETTKDRLLTLEAEKANLTQTIDEEESHYAPITAKSVRAVLKRMINTKDKTEEELRKGIAEIFIHKCFLWEDRLIIAYNITDKATNELMKSEIEFLTKETPPDNKDEKGSSAVADGSPKGTM